MQKLAIKKIRSALSRVEQSKKLALGYPTNRLPIFKIDNNLMNEVSAVYTINIASPFMPNSFFGCDVSSIEVELVRRLAEHFKLEQSEMFGYITSGGTEGSIAGCWCLRDGISNKFKQ